MAQSRSTAQHHRPAHLPRIPDSSKSRSLGTKMGPSDSHEHSLRPRPAIQRDAPDRPGHEQKDTFHAVERVAHAGFISRAEQTPAVHEVEVGRKGRRRAAVLLTLIHFGSRWKTPTGSQDRSPDPGREVRRYVPIATPGSLGGRPRRRRFASSGPRRNPACPIP